MLASSSESQNSGMIMDDTVTIISSHFINWNTCHPKHASPKKKHDPELIQKLNEILNQQVQSRSCSSPRDVKTSYHSIGSRLPSAFPNGIHLRKPGPTLQPRPSGSHVHTTVTSSSEKVMGTLNDIIIPVVLVVFKCFKTIILVKCQCSSWMMENRSQMATKRVLPKERFLDDGPAQEIPQLRFGDGHAFALRKRTRLGWRNWLQIDIFIPWRKWTTLGEQVYSLSWRFVGVFWVHWAHVWW